MLTYPYGLERFAAEESSPSRRGRQGWREGAGARGDSRPGALLRGHGGSFHEGRNEIINSRFNEIK